MAQLIKLEDYVSRYEWDTYRYPGQFIRLKKENWKKMRILWEQAKEEMLNAKQTEPFSEEKEEKEASRFRFLRLNLFKHKEEPIEEQEEETNEFDEQLARFSLNELKYHFLEKLFPFQIKWATSTVSQVSFVNSNYFREPNLKYFLQRFPDTYLLMYRPIFNIKNTAVEAEIIMISPIGIEIIAFAEAEPEARIMAGDERSWLIEGQNQARRFINPVISLRRTEKLIRSILKTKALEFPIRKTVLSRTNQLIFVTEPYQTDLIDKMRYDDWLKEKRQLTSPLKGLQLKVTETLLSYCQTTSIRRPEWEEDDSLFTVNELENHFENEQM